MQENGPRWNVREGCNPLTFKGNMEVVVRRSRTFLRLAAVLHAAALALLAAESGVLEWWLAGLLPAVLLSGWRVHVGHQPARGLRLTGDGRWFLRLQEGVETPARLLLPVLVHPALTILRFRCEDGCRRTVLLLGDSVDEDAWRRLRVRLRLDSGLLSPESGATSGPARGSARAARR